MFPYLFPLASPSLPPSPSHPSRWSQSTELISLCYAAGCILNRPSFPWWDALCNLIRYVHAWRGLFIQFPWQSRETNGGVSKPRALTEGGTGWGSRGGNVGSHAVLGSAMPSGAFQKMPTFKSEF